MNLHASYWKYDGNHLNGEDCICNDPHNFGVEIVSYLACVADGGPYGKLSKQQLSQVKVVHCKGDSFRHKIKVSAPKEIWDAAKTDYEEVQEEDLAVFN